GGLSSYFFKVTPSDNGEDTVLTLVQGNPVAMTVRAPAAWQEGANGAGIKIGIISDSFNNWGVFSNVSNESNDITNGALPPANQIKVIHDRPPPGVNEAYADEGRAMAQIVHDIAPNAAIDFYAASTPEEMATAIDSLYSDGCQIIVDDLGFDPQVD